MEKLDRLVGQFDDVCKRKIQEVNATKSKMLVFLTGRKVRL